MKVDVLASPFRFNSDGSAAKVVQGSDAHKAQQLASLVRTTFGELPLAPTYGVGDLAFMRIDIADIAVQINAFHPDIAIEDIILYQTSTGRNTFEILFKSETST